MKEKNKKYFYGAVLDGYQYPEVSTVRYKNFVDYAIHCWKDTIVKDLRNFIGDDEEIDCWESFFSDYFGYTTYYFAMDEDGNMLKNMEDNDVTLRNFCKEHKLIK